MQKDEMLQDIKAARKLLDNAIRSIPTKLLEKHESVDAWSFKDLIGHIAVWDAEVIRIISDLLVGRPLPNYPPDFNDHAAADLHDKSPQELLALYVQNYQIALDFFQGMVSSALGHPDVLRMVHEQIEHYRHHAKAIVSRLEPR
jgi:hypothetical protein